MEQNEKNQEVPQWVKIIADFPAPCQQSIGNVCSSIVQNLCMIACVSAELVDAIIREVDSQCALEHAIAGHSPDTSGNIF